MEITSIESKEIIYMFLKRFDDNFVRKISGRVKNLEEYAEKLYVLARNYVLYQEKEIVGFFSFYDNDSIGKKAYLTMIVIEKKYRGMELGSQAIRFICEECRKKQMKKLCLEVDKANRSAYQFYMKQGFGIVGDASEYSFYMEKEI